MEISDTTDKSYGHIPVLFNEVMESFSVLGDSDCRLIDGTLGRAGHAAGLLKRHPNMKLLGIDRDGEALAKSSERLSFAGDRVKLVHGVFSRLDEIAAEHDFVPVDGVLLDLGVSSPQIDDGRRGFSWREDGPLDMRMDKSSELTASRVLNRCSESELADIFYRYGEVRQSRALAAEVVRRRSERPLSMTSELVEICDRVLGKARKGELPRPTLVFQALRIAVNDELGELERGLNAALKVLKNGGILAVISFHSLEDRMVKNFFRDKSKDCICPPQLPICVCNHHRELEVLTKKPLIASAAELAENRRAGCAKLRTARICKK